jgi:hypothetical protein
MDGKVAGQSLIGQAVMDLTIRQLHPLFAGEITGIDVGRPLDADTVEALNAAIDRYAVLVLRDQELDDERQMAFARNFGELELPRSGAANVKRRLPPAVADISNLDEENQVRGRDDPRRFDQLGNRLWHTDGSFRRVPAALSMLYAHRVPGASSKGNGETEFADMRAAYDALSDIKRARSPILSRCTTSLGRAASWGLASCCLAKNRFCRRCRSAWCARIRARSASALCRGACLGDCRLAGAGRPAVAARADRARDTA